MVINHDKKFIFIHIPKNGGTSMYKSFGQPSKQYDWHIPAKYLRSVVSEEIWNTYYKFAFIRNPWDRLVSLYHFIGERESTGEFNEWVTTYDDSKDRGARQENGGYFGQTAPWDKPVSSARKSQLYYVTDDSGELILDYIYRFEYINRGLWNLVLDHTNMLPKNDIENHFPAHVRQRKDKTPYTEFYNEKGLAHVDKYFKKDVEFFNYEFGKEE